MAKNTKPKPERKVVTEFYGVNIKLLSPTRKGDDMYVKLFQQIFNGFRQIEIGYGKAMCLLRMDKREAEIEGKKLIVFTGEMAKFSILETDDWLDFEKRVKTKHILPENLFPNLITEEYVFIPYAHRFYFKATSKITVNNVIEFFKQAGDGLVGENEEYSVTQISSQDQVDRILNSQTLIRLQVDLTYTNDDLGDDASEVMDELFKEGKAARVNITMTPRSKQEGLDTDSTLVSGLVQLAKDNGTAKATIKETQRRKPIKVNTNTYPERIQLEASKTANPMWELFLKIVTERINESRKRE